MNEYILKHTHKDSTRLGVGAPPFSPLLPTHPFTHSCSNGALVAVRSPYPKGAGSEAYTGGDDDDEDEDDNDGCPKEVEGISQ